MTLTMRNAGKFRLTVPVVIGCDAIEQTGLFHNSKVEFVIAQFLVPGGYRRHGDFECIGGALI